MTAVAHFPFRLSAGAALGVALALAAASARADDTLLLGDMDGLRPLLARHGMSLSLQETSEVLGNVIGGVQRGFDYEGLIQAQFQLDTAKAFGWAGGTVHASALQIHGRNLTADHLAVLQTASGIEAERATRLWELWYDQQLDHGALDVKIGQQSLDHEFMITPSASAFVNAMFGWSALSSTDMPGGGPVYPLGVVGLRVQARPTKALTLRAGLFNGSPGSSHGGDTQQQNPAGIGFPLDSGALAIAEIQYAPSADAVFKFGGWYDSERFADLRYGDHGLSLANPASTGVPEQHRGDYSLYILADGTLWQDQLRKAHRLDGFARINGAPEVDRNLVTVSVDFGLTLAAPFQGRDGDTAGIGVGFAQISPRAAALDRDRAFFTSSFTPLRTHETFIEATYSYAATPWLQLQPDFQYFFNPAGGLAKPSGGKIGDEAVLGLRGVVQF